MAADRGESAAVPPGTAVRGPGASRDLRRLTAEQSAALGAYFPKVQEYVGSFLRAHPSLAFLRDEIESDIVELSVAAASRFEPDRGLAFSTYFCDLMNWQFCSFRSGHFNRRMKSPHSQFPDSCDPDWSFEELVESPAETETPEYRELDAARRREAEALPEQWREILELRIGGGMTFTEIGDRLGRHQTSVSDTWARALRRLRLRLCRFDPAKKER